MPQIDYAALARQHGGQPVSRPPTPAPAVDYAAIARQFGGTPSQPVPMPEGALLDGTPSTPNDKPQPDQRLAGIGIKTVSDEDWNAMSARERMQGLLKAGGYAVTSALGMGEAGREAVDNPGMTLATAAVGPAATAVKASIPSFARAGANFQSVMGAARSVPVDLKASGPQAYRIWQLSERGGSMPKVVRDLLKRVTDPEKGPMVYEEARDFATNISRLSADEMNRLAPVMKREIGTLRAQFNSDVRQAAAKAGKLKEYDAAMREYRRASQFRDVKDDVVKGVKQAAPWAAVTGAAAYGASRLSDLVRGR